MGKLRLKDDAAPEERDAQEFERLYRESYPKVCGYVRRRMGDDAATEDVVAEAYLLAARSFHRFDPQRALFSTWVTRIAINYMVSYYRRERQLVSLEDMHESVVSWEDEFDVADDRELVSRLFSVLDERSQRLVIMKYHDGMRNIDIAQELGMNPSTVSTALSRAVAKMREAYEGSM